MADASRTKETGTLSSFAVSSRHKEILVTELRKKMTDELVRRNYSEGTVRSYLRSVQEFARYFNRAPHQLGL